MLNIVNDIKRLDWELARDIQVFFLFKKGVPSEIGRPTVIIKLSVSDVFGTNKDY